MIDERARVADTMSGSDVLLWTVGRDPILRPTWGSMLKGVDSCITNVPGPTFETHLAGARIERMYAVAPPSEAALNGSLVRSADRICIGVVVDRAAAPDSPQLATCFAAGLEAVPRLGCPIDGQRP